MKLTKWQKEIIDKCKTISNDELLNTVIGLAGGDDYDGCMTGRGQWEFEYMNILLRKKLVEANFIKTVDYKSLKNRTGNREVVDLVYGNIVID